MAEGFLRAAAGDRFGVESAGTEKTRVHPLAIRAMGEVGIDIEPSVEDAGWIPEPALGLRHHRV